MSQPQRGNIIIEKQEQQQQNKSPSMVIYT